MKYQMLTRRHVGVVQQVMSVIIQRKFDIYRYIYIYNQYVLRTSSEYMFYFRHMHES